MELVWIPAGEFMMGSSLSASDTAVKHGGNEDNYTREHPQHPVTISKGFWMSRYEVTQYQYKLIMGKNPSQFKYKCEHCGKFIPGNILRDDFLTEDTYTYPVETVAYDEAVEFCKKLSQKEGEIYLLPTEAQWEYACRAGSTTEYYFGNDSNSLGDYAWYDKNSNESTHPVGQRKPNAWGLYDMYGNAEEWCKDGYSSDYYSTSPKTDPYNSDCKNGKYFLRVCRGGGFIYSDKYCRSAFRLFDVAGSEDESTSYPNPMIGFRVICVSKE
jgi:formylglycine-generating enzyme required for sulfatase activity